MEALTMEDQENQERAVLGEEPPKEYVFEAQMKQSGTMDAAYIEFPYKVKEEFGTGGQVKVKAFIDGVEYRGSLAPMGLGSHCLGITKAVRSQAGKHFGDILSIRLWRDTEPRIVEVPEDVQKLLEEQGLSGTFSRLSYSKRRACIAAITGSKRPETREKRVRELVEDLLR
jgi:hypothetical protein